MLKPKPSEQNVVTNFKIRIKIKFQWKREIKNVPFYVCFMYLGIMLESKAMEKHFMPDFEAEFIVEW